MGLTFGKTKALSWDTEHVKEIEEAAAKTADYEAYKRTIAFLFSDGVVNMGRLHVLKMYTERVCCKLSPEEENRMMAYYRSWIDYVEIIEPVLVRKWKIVNY